MADSIHPEGRAWLEPEGRDFPASVNKRVFIGTIATTLCHMLPKWCLFPGTSPEAIPQIPPLPLGPFSAFSLLLVVSSSLTAPYRHSLHGVIAVPCLTDQHEGFQV